MVARQLATQLSHSVWVTGLLELFDSFNLQSEVNMDGLALKRSDRHEAISGSASDTLKMTVTKKSYHFASVEDKSTESECDDLSYASHRMSAVSCAL